MSKGKAHGLKNAGYRALYSLSCEKGTSLFSLLPQNHHINVFNIGYHLWGYDLRSDDTPIESNLGFSCRKSGDYQGKDTVDRQRAEGVSKRLVFLTLEEDKPLWGWEGVYRNGVPVGQLRRGEYAYTLGKPIGRAFVSNPNGPTDEAFILSGNYQIDIMGELYPAKCYLRSTFDTKNQRIFGVYD